LTDLFSLSYWRLATQICDLEGHDVPKLQGLSVICIIYREMLQSICICEENDLLYMFLANQKLQLEARK